MKKIDTLVVTADGQKSRGSFASVLFSYTNEISAHFLELKTPKLFFAYLVFFSDTARELKWMTRYPEKRAWEEQLKTSLINGLLRKGVLSPIRIHT